MPSNDFRARDVLKGHFKDMLRSCPMYVMVMSYVLKCDFKFSKGQDRPFTTKHRIFPFLANANNHGPMNYVKLKKLIDLLIKC